MGQQVLRSFVPEDKTAKAWEGLLRWNCGRAGDYLFLSGHILQSDDGHQVEYR